MRCPARINIKVLAVLVVVTGLLCGGAVIGHYVRKRHTADRALAAGRAALARQDWPTACKHLKQYLYNYPDDVAMLEAYGRANLAVRPRERTNIAAAIAAYRRLLRHRPADDAICETLATLYFQAGNLDDARYICRLRLEQAPADADALKVLALVKLAQQEPADAGAHLKALVAARPDDAMAYVLLKEVALAQAESTGMATARDEAGQWLDACVEANPASPVCLAQRANFLRTVRGDFDAARRDLEALEQVGHNDLRSMLLAVEEWVALGVWDRAERLLDAAMQLDPAASARFDLGADTLSFMRFVTAAQLAALQRHTVAAADVCAEALAVIPERDRVTRTPLRVRFLPMAVEHFLRAGRVEQARSTVAAYRTAVGANDPDRLALMEAAVASAENEPYIVIRLLEPVIARSPRARQAWKLLAGAYESTGQPWRAIDTYEKYLELIQGEKTSRRDPEVERKLAKAFLRRDPERAHRYAALLLQDDPDDVDARLVAIDAVVRATPQYGVVLQRESIELDALRADHPTSGHVRVLQARILAKQGRVESAIATLRDAIEEADDKPESALQLVRQLRDADRLGDAIEAAKTLVSLREDLAIPRILLSELLKDDGQADEARRVLEVAGSELAGGERLTARVALAQHMLLYGDRADGIALIETLAAAHPESLHLRLGLLRLPEIRRDGAKAQRLVDEIRRIEGGPGGDESAVEDADANRGLWWRLAQAEVWMRTDAWQRDADMTARIEAMLQYCVRANRSWADPVLSLGRMYESLGSDDNAETVYRESLASQPVHISVVNRLLALLQRQMRFAEAHELLARWPDHPAFSTHRVDVAVGEGDYAAAREELERRLVDDPTDAASRVVKARLDYAETHDVDGAFALLDEALALNPDLLAAVNAKAWILHQEGRGAEAMILVDGEVARRKDFAAYLLRANLHAADGDLEAAERDLKHLTTFPDAQAEAYAALGRFYREFGDRDDAINAWRTGLQHDPDNMPVQRLLAKALATSPDAEAAREGRQRLDDMLAVLPNDVELLAARATALLRLDTPVSREAARRDLERVVELDPRRVVAHVQLIQLARQAHDLPTASNRVRVAIGANPGNVKLITAQAQIEAELGHGRVARELAQSVRVRDPKEVNARLVLLGLAQAERNLPEVERLIEEIVAVEPGNEAALLAHAELLDAHGDRAGAIRELEAHRRQRGTDTAVGVHLALAEFYRRDGDFASAGACVAQAEQGAPDSMDVFAAKVSLLAAQGRFEDIATAYHGLRPSAKDDATALVSTGVALMASGREAELRQAVALLERAVEHEPRRFDAYVRLAQAHYLLGAFDAAADAYARLLERDPYNYQAINDRAWILARNLDEPEAALALADKGVLHDPNRPNLRDTRGVILTQLGRLAEARRELERCLELTEHRPALRQTRAHALLHLGDVLAKLGDVDQARARFNEALALDRQHGVLTEDERNEARRHVVETTP
ncbi:MAG: tetratricopeptide repeat protein [Phycisphaerae bacterium]